MLNMCVTVRRNILYGTCSFNYHTVQIINYLVLMKFICFQFLDLVS